MVEQLMYFSAWRERTFTCEGCGWSGRGADFLQEMFEDHLELWCPDTCDHHVATCAFPRSAEVEAAAAEGNKEAIAMLERGPIRRPPPTGVIRRTYTLTTWKGWDHAIDGFVQDFRAHFTVAPNILLSNSTTQARIDMAAKKEKLSNDAGEHPADGEYAPVTGFTGDDYHLDFFLDEALPDRTVSLIYDADPNGGGEPVPEEDTAVEVGAAAAMKRRRSVA